METAAPKRNDQRIIIHFDYDCFYAAVFERENPALKSLPLAVQQKQIIVTCNYEARRRGLYKLQLIRDAKEKCPDVIIVLGEDLTRFRNASKDNYNFLRSYVWSNRVERLGFDEVFMDVTDMVQCNLELLNRNDLSASFFHLDRSDPTVGFSCDASSVFGHTFPANALAFLPDSQGSDGAEDLPLRLQLGSQLAQHLRYQLEERMGYTSTAGISTNKLLSKLIGNVNKPNGQTTLMPPYTPGKDEVNHINHFIDSHDISKIPGIGFKIAQRIRSHVLGRPAAFDAGLVYGGTKENVTARDVRCASGMGPKLLERILNGPGVPRDLPGKVWGLVNGVDDTEVAKGREVPQQISIEDSYIRLDELTEVEKELKMLATSLIKRMRLDLTSRSEDELPDDKMDDTTEPDQRDSSSALLRWIAHPKTLRLSTRPRPPLNADGTRSRTFTRISKSGPMPTFVFSLGTDAEDLSDKLVLENLLPLFRRLHPEKSGWNLSLVNVCATNMTITASDSRDGAGRDISRMFKRQDEVLKRWKVEDVDKAPSDGELEKQKWAATAYPEHRLEMKTSPMPDYHWGGSEDIRLSTQESNNDSWDSGDENAEIGEVCRVCGAVMPAFAMSAHERFHELAE